MKSIEVGEVSGGKGTVTVTVEPGKVEAAALVAAVNAARGGSKFQAKVVP